MEPAKAQLLIIDAVLVYAFFIAPYAGPSSSSSLPPITMPSQIPPYNPHSKLASSSRPSLPGISQLSPPTPGAAQLPPGSTSTSSLNSRANPMSVSSMVSGAYGRDRTTGPYPILGVQRRDEPHAHEKSQKGQRAIDPSLSRSAGSSVIDAIPSYRYPSAQVQGEKGKEHGSPKVPAAGGYGSPPVSGMVPEGDKDKVSIEGPVRTERSYPPIPSAFARESPYSTWPAPSERENSGGYVDRHGNLPAVGEQSSKGAASGPGSTASQAPFFPGIGGYGRPANAAHRHSSSSSSIPPASTTYPGGFPWPPAPANPAPSRDYYFNDNSRDSGSSASREQELHKHQQHQQQQSQQHSHHSPQTHSQHSQSSKQSSSRFGNAPARSEASRQDHYNNNLSSSRRYPLTPSSNAFGDSQHEYPSSLPPTSSRLDSNSQREGRQAPSTSSALASSVSGSHPAGSTSAERHKRRRSEGNALHDNQEGPFPQQSDNRPAKVAKSPLPLAPPPPPPFTISQQRLADIRPPLLSIRSEALLAAITPAIIAASRDDQQGRPYLGRAVYDPFVEPSKLVDGEVLRNGIGGVVEIALNLGWLEGWAYEFGDPSKYEGGLVGASPKSDTKGKGVALSEDEQSLQNSIPPEVWDLEPIKKRMVWGTDVYTDDSDVLAILLHSGWLRLGPTKEKRNGSEADPLEKEEGAGEERLNGTVNGHSGEVSKPGREDRTLVVRFLVGPALVRYQGCTRQGLKSRSWGNGHDGVSLLIESVVLLEVIKADRRQFSPTYLLIACLQI